MDPERVRIQDDLRGQLAGDVRCDDLFLQLYSTDASIHQIRPLAVVAPRNAADVVTCVSYAAENHLPLVARGAGTGLAGESLGSGIVLDFSRYMTRILESGPDYVRVQPGVIHAQLNRYLARHGRTFGPDPAMSHVTTMGSVVAIDASGSHWLKYGSARRHVRRLQVVLADGTLAHVGNEPLDNADDSVSRRRELVGDVAQLLSHHRELVEKHQPKSRVNRCGYQLQDVLSDGHVNLPHLLSGSEGTLALFTDIEVATQPLPACRGVCLLLFDSLESAARAVMEVLPFEPSACDLLDRRHLSLAREHDVRFDLLIPAETEALLLVEAEGADTAEVRDRLGRIVEQTHRRSRLALGFRQALDSEEVDLYWQLARKVVPTLYRLKGPSRPLPFVEDVAVPPEVLPQFLSRILGVLRRHQVTAALFGHAGHGQLHLRPFLNLVEPSDVDRMQRLADELFNEVLLVGGTITGEHGDGLSRTSFVARQYGPLTEVFREIKRIFDPADVFNPGKIVSNDHDLLTRNLRRSGLRPESGNEAATESAVTNPIASLNEGKFGGADLQLYLNVVEMAQDAQSCNGCGACRSQQSDVRMCPIFRLAPREEASPRAKANLVRAVLSGALPPESVSSDDFKSVADLCVNCHQCRMECPAGVDIPRLMIEAKAAYVSVNGLRPTDWFMSRLDLVSSWGSRTPWLANWAIGNRQARWVIEKLFGLAQGRKLPRFARQPFLRRAIRRRLTRTTRGSDMRVLLFLDLNANYFDTRLAESLVAVLEHNGVSVYVPPDQTPSAMAMISLGAVEKARRIASRNVAILAEAVRQGYHIVTPEPAAASCLVHEYPALLGDDDAKLVASNTSEACTYLWRLHHKGKLLLDLKPINATVAYHLPCHLKSLDVGSPGENLMRLIPGLTVTRVEKGCSGMAGTYGMKRENYRSSLRAGFDLISTLRDPTFQAGTTECTACKMQMEQGTTKPTIHPVKLLALAYGLLGPDEPLLSVRGRDLVTT